MRTTPLIGTKAWFGPRRVGWGLGPTTWEGWALTGGFIALVILKGTSPGGPNDRARLERER